MTINKLSSIVHSRLVAQAEEAKNLNLEELANGVLSAIGPTPRDNQEEFAFSRAELESSVHQSLWKVAMEVVAYHDLKTADIQSIEASVKELTATVLSEVESSLKVSEDIGPFDKSLPGVK